MTRQSLLYLGQPHVSGVWPAPQTGTTGWSWTVHPTVIEQGLDNSNCTCNSRRMRIRNKVPVVSKKSICMLDHKRKSTFKIIISGMNEKDEWGVWMRSVNGMCAWEVWMRSVNGMCACEVWMWSGNGKWEWKVGMRSVNEECKWGVWKKSMNEEYEWGVRMRSVNEAQVWGGWVKNFKH